jgi:hypothetical protein
MLSGFPQTWHAAVPRSNNVVGWEPAAVLGVSFCYLSAKGWTLHPQFERCSATVLATSYFFR